jgi:hypothetical protein
MMLQVGATGIGLSAGYLARVFFVARMICIGNRDFSDGPMPRCVTWHGERDDRGRFLVRERLVYILSVEDWWQ